MHTHTHICTHNCLSLIASIFVIPMCRINQVVSELLCSVVMCLEIYILTFGPLKGPNCVLLDWEAARSSVLGVCLYAQWSSSTISVLFKTHFRLWFYSFLFKVRQLEATFAIHAWSRHSGQQIKAGQQLFGVWSHLKILTSARLKRNEFSLHWTKFYV